jgi:AraC-like DNA-binding protein
MYWQELKPRDKQLQLYIDKFVIKTGNWSQAKNSDVLRIFPRTGVSLFFDFARSFSKETSWMQSGLNGIHDKYYLLNCTPNSTLDEIMVQFTAFGLSMFSDVDIPMHELKNNLVDSSVIFGSCSSHLYERLGNITSNEKRIALIENAFKKSIRAPKNVDRLIQEIANGIIQNQYLPSSITINRLSNLSFRQVERQFQDVIGINMRSFYKITRFERAKIMLEEEDNKPLTEITYKCNYYDQAHFIHEFKEQSGLTPGKYRKWVKPF